MPSTASSTKKTSSASNPKTTALNSYIQNEAARLAELHTIDAKTLEAFATFVIEHHKQKEPKPPKTPLSSKSSKVAKVKPLTLPQLKASVFKHFGAKDLKVLKASGSFQMATSGMGKLDLSTKPAWESLYRKFIGILPGEENETGNGCVNGINIFKYDMPWKAFALDPQMATIEDIKVAYRNLSRIYHPDIPNTGNAEIFNRLNTFYRSLTERF
jgi:hypothetical protein